MKNYTKLIVTLVALTTMSAKVYGYEQTITNYTADTLEATWYGIAVGHPQQTLAPFPQKGHTQSWGSGGGCADHWMITGPRGQVRYNIKGDKCWATNVSVYYKKNIYGQPIGYQVCGSDDAECPVVP